MVTREAVVAEARRWLDTPYRHQARMRGAGCDCGGLIGGVAVALSIVPAGWWRDSFDPQFGGYGRQPVDGTLRRICESFMRRVEVKAFDIGDVLLMRFESEPQHLAIAADYRHGGMSVVHAMSRVGKVAEHRLSPLWAARVVAAFEYPGIE